MKWVKGKHPQLPIAIVALVIALGACGKVSPRENLPVRKSIGPANTAYVHGAVRAKGEGTNYGPPVSGATIRLDPWGFQVKSEQDGTYRFPGLKIPDPVRCVWGTLTVTATNYGEYVWENIIVQRGDSGYTIELEKKAVIHKESVPGDACIKGVPSAAATAFGSLRPADRSSER
jgi:hypothetical protein